MTKALFIVTSKNLITDETATTRVTTPANTAEAAVASLARSLEQTFLAEKGWQVSGVRPATEEEARSRW